jgi:hypothetical protein
MAAIDAVPDGGTLQVEDYILNMRGFHIADFTEEVENFHRTFYLRRYYTLRSLPYNNPAAGQRQLAGNKKPSIAGRPRELPYFPENATYIIAEL